MFIPFTYSITTYYQFSIPLSQIKNWSLIFCPEKISNSCLNLTYILWWISIIISNFEFYWLFHLKNIINLEWFCEIWIQVVVHSFCLTQFIPLIICLKGNNYKRIRLTKHILITKLPTRNEYFNLLESRWLVHYY